MSESVYRELLKVMKKRGGGYSGMDIPEYYAMVETMFSPEEARVNNAMPRGPFTAEKLSEILQNDHDEVLTTLEEMADKGLCTAFKVEGVQYYMSARFAPGMMEYPFMSGSTSEWHKKLAVLIQKYKKAFDRNSQVDASDFPPFRVITIDKAVEAENTVRTYDQVQTYIDANEDIAVSQCFCRHAALLRGEDIHGMPNEVCMTFGILAKFAIERLGAKKLSREEAREVLDRSEEAGLVHMVQNMADDVGFICNCDRWHCVTIQTAFRYQKPGLYFNSGFDPRFDADLCTACETCIDRCPSEALALKDDLPEVDFDRCFGCAVCASGCDDNAISMVNKMNYTPPPANAAELKIAFREGRGK